MLTLADAAQPQPERTDIEGWRSVIKASDEAMIGFIAMAGALALTRLMTSLLFRVQASDPITFVLVAAVLIAVSLGACLVPARRAAKVDPIVALRYE